MDGDETHDESSANAGSRRIRPLGAMVRVVCEQGRWTVLLNVASWEADRTQWAGSWPVINNWKRIHDYATERDAHVAAEWIARAVNRSFAPYFDI